jgi:hypothetical protein
MNPKKKKFYDKNGTRIKLGDKLKIPVKDKYFYKDGIVVEEGGELGLRFVHQNLFIPLNELLDDFFKSCEVIEKKE